MNRWILIALIALALVTFVFKKQIYETGVEVYEYMKSVYDDLFKKWGSHRGVDWKLLRAIATVESNLKPFAIGDNGAAMGMMQVQHWHWEALGYSKEEMLDPDKNVETGSAFIADLLRKYDGDMDSAIQAYNLGETKFNKGYTSLSYLAKVKKEYEKLQAIEI